MPDVATYSVVRQGDNKIALPARRNAVILEPVLDKSGAIARLTAATLSALTPLERVLNRRWLQFLGDHAMLPAGKAAPAKKATDLPPDAEGSFAKLYGDLHAAWQVQDAPKLEAIASGHLQQQATSGAAAIDPFTRSLYEHFKARGCDGTGAEIIALVGNMTNQQINDYLTSSAQLVSKLKAQAFAAMVNGTLSQQGIDLLLAIKSIGAFQLIAAAILNYGRDPAKIPVKLICALLDADICFPEWTFDVDPCRWPKHGDGESNPRTGTSALQARPDRATAIAATAHASTMADSPLKQRIRRDALATERRIASVAAVAIDAAGLPRKPGPPPKPNLAYDCDCEHAPPPPCLPPDPCCAKINYYVTDTLVLRDATKRYVASDLAYIENIAAGETRVREHSFVKTIEDYTEEEVTTTRSEERDHQVTERFSVQNEIENSLKIDADAHAEYDGATANGGKYKLSADLSVSKETAQKEAREQFREAVDKAVTKLQVETRKLTTRRVTTREEEKNSHSFINTSQDAKHIVAKYFYVSKEVEGQVFSHGLRTTVELLLPEPAALYEHLEATRIRRGFGMEKPKFENVPATWLDVDHTKYKEYLDEFDLDKLQPPPKKPEARWESPTFEGTAGTSKTITIPEGFYISKIHLVGDPSVSYKGSNTGGTLTFTLNGNSVWYGVSKSDSVEDILGGGGKEDEVDRTYDKDVDIRGSSAELQITTTEAITNYSAQFQYYLFPLPIDYSAWQQNAFVEIMAKVNAANKAYDEAYAKYMEQANAEKAGRHPFANKEIILAELKRAAIYMMCEDFERGEVMARRTPPCGFPEINRKTANKECANWYFWETAFDWRLMSFIFFDYFWNRKCDWPEKFAPGHDDFMFNAFLRSGMARIMVPVRPGMEADVIFYLETGQKWGFGGQPPVNPLDPRWISVVEELKHSRDCYQNDREGMIHAMLDPASLPGLPVLQSMVLLTGSDRYWDPLANTLNQAAIDGDTGREIFIDGLRYRIVSIHSTIDPALTAYHDPAAPAYDPTAPTPTMWWKITLDRPLEATITVAVNGDTVPDFAYAIGAAYVGAPFRWQEPTNLVWLSDAGNVCLPSYPVVC